MESLKIYGDLFDLDYNDKEQIDCFDDYCFIDYYTESLFFDWGKYYKDNKKSPETLNIIKQHLNKIEFKRFCKRVNDFHNFGNYFNPKNKYTDDSLLEEIFNNRFVLLEMIKLYLSSKFYYLKKLYQIKN